MVKEIEFDGFSINTFLDENGEWIAHFVELPNISAGGDSVEEAIYELKEAWELAKEVYEEEGMEIPKAPSLKDYSGRFHVRIDKRLHRTLALEAGRAGVSLNALVAQKLAQSGADGNAHYTS